MKLSFGTATATKELRKPEPTRFPQLRGVDIAALYQAARVGGDFFDFLTPRSSKLLFILMDIAGERETALHIAAQAQDRFRELGVRLFQSEESEDSVAVTELMLELNREVLQTAGVRCAPAFLGCYDDDIGTMSYVNAGHTPGLLKDQDGITFLEANGLPLGLFSHSTYAPQFCALRPGAAVVLVSKGVVENRSGGEEFGMERVLEILTATHAPSATAICRSILNAVHLHEQKPNWFGPTLAIPGFGHERNDVTTLALLRRA